MMPLITKTKIKVKAERSLKMNELLFTILAVECKHM
jgi:hypothetical protein